MSVMGQHVGWTRLSIATAVNSFKQEAATTLNDCNLSL
jgi:hypothetical protein